MALCRPRVHIGGVVRRVRNKLSQTNRSSVVHHASGALGFADSSGTHWTVSEIARLEFSEKLMTLLPHPERRAGWLLFESNKGERRRYSPIPENWRELTTAALEGCLDAAVHATVLENRRREDEPPLGS